MLFIDLKMEDRGSSVEEMVLGLWKIKGFSVKSGRQGRETAERGAEPRARGEVTL